MTAVVFENVSKSFGGRTVLDEASFSLEAGGRYGLVGPNGAGKSTLLKLIMGVLRPETGRVRVGGLSPWERPVRSRAGFLPEGAPLIGELTVREHLILASCLRGLTPGQLSAEEDRLTAALSLGGFYRRPAAALSQGQKRRAALASALLGSPALLVLDEPASGLDPEEAGRLLALLGDLPASTTLLLSSHLLSDLRDLAGPVLTLASGRLTMGGPLAGADGAALRRDYLARVGGEAGR